MSLRPIDLTPKEVQVIQSGENLQIRRKVKPKSGGEIIGWGGPAIAMEEIPCDEPDTQHVRTVLCPYGQVGDRLFVREAFGTKIRNVGGTPHEQYAYKADNPNEVKFFDCNGQGRPIKWKAAPKMPRKAARLFLEIQEISVVPKYPTPTNKPNPFMWVIKFVVIQDGVA
ncbi:MULTISPECIES: hypothetical protein [unclassified Acinetobacter]|uniref:hypothetical protein n=1 Tax=unclassified Acinetobacter TaxID=196816 RepID=UPI00244C5A38|nr:MULTISPECIES: hypothetical protein [unclassified Acinetobacter]MDH0032539.1 hypothetical protein [Acinetobacter sp. GD04021]MDH0885230.1 hypothetical protein [Acinetobacter sp. GD03873]MDH1084442.1 hypothetical protein [Acinetobacter sp. GD03983]MDH2188330.1 hypothetical protein [Acinetobacter sp. GD03645]MDH2203841.1 hypothetical protein [Acinetobacter sp. GD03647]